MFFRRKQQPTAGVTGKETSMNNLKSLAATLDEQQRIITDCLSANEEIGRLHDEAKAVREKITEAKRELAETQQLQAGILNAVAATRRECERIREDLPDEIRRCERIIESACAMTDRRGTLRDFFLKSRGWRGNQLGSWTHQTLSKGIWTDTVGALKSEAAADAAPYADDVLQKVTFAVIESKRKVREPVAVPA
jgi:hypothetical protein